MKINLYTNKLQEKFSESLKAVLPVMAIVLILSFTVAPIPSGIMLGFLFGGFLVVTGMMLFSLGAELAMEPMGRYLGTRITKTKKLWLILILSFVLGLMITISEPDLQVLAGQISSVPSTVLILTVGIGVGIFLVIAMLRMLFSKPLRTLLFVFYGAVFAIALFVPDTFHAIAFDSGGVTTGPMTVPFIMAFGVGVSAIRSDRHAADDSFGLVSLCSIGPILAVLILSLVFRLDSAEYELAAIRNVAQSRELAGMFAQSLPAFLEEIAIALIPIAAFFFIFLLFCPGLNKLTVSRILSGLVYTYAGLVIFLLGVNVGFMPAGNYFGEVLGSLEYNWIVIPIGMLIGYFIVKAEPAVYVLMDQVEDLTDGDISGKSLQVSLSIGVAVSVGLSMIRVLTGIPIMWFLIPGYAVALVLTLFVPKIFTAIAFDSGGVASGPMTATFLLPFAIGVCTSTGGTIVTDAFGVVAMVAMTPLITIQILGVVYKIRSMRHTVIQAEQDAFAELDNYAIIDF